MYRHKCWALALVACLLLGIVAGFSQDASRKSGSSPKIRLAMGSRAPDFFLQSVNGETVRLSDLRGQTVLIEFWATWCGPCKVMMPWLVDLQNRYGTSGFHVLAVSLDDDATRVEIGEYADQNHMTFPVLLGNEKVAESYGGVPAMPETILVGPNGRVSEIIVGLRSESELEGSLRKSLNKQGAATADTLGDSQAQK